VILNYPILESLFAFVLVFLIGYLSGNSRRRTAPNTGTNDERRA
jgi:hypothetical protein